MVMASRVACASAGGTISRRMRRVSRSTAESRVKSSERWFTTRIVVAGGSRGPRSAEIRIEL